MPEATPADPTKEKSKFSPFAGCSIFIIAGLLAVGMISFTFWIGTRIEKTIEGFTQENPKPIEQIDLNGKENQQVTLKSKLVEFRHKIETEKAGKISLTPEEINLAIATFTILKPQRGNLHVTAITEEGIRAQISNPINSKMSNIISKDKRFRHLNGTIFIRPELVENAVFPRITTIQADGGGSVPDEFRQQISKTLLAPFKDDQEIGPLFTRISSVEINDGAIILTTNPEQKNTETLPTTDTQPVFERFMKGFAIVAILFLAIIATIIILSRRKAAQSQTTKH